MTDAGHRQRINNLQRSAGAVAEQLTDFPDLYDETKRNGPFDNRREMMLTRQQAAVSRADVWSSRPVGAVHPRWASHAGLDCWPQDGWTGPPTQHPVLEHVFLCNRRLCSIEILTLHGVTSGDLQKLLEAPAHQIQTWKPVLESDSMDNGNCLGMSKVSFSSKANRSIEAFVRLARWCQGDIWKAHW